MCMLLYISRHAVDLVKFMGYECIHHDHVMDAHQIYSKGILCSHMKNGEKLNFGNVLIVTSYIG